MAERAVYGARRLEQVPKAELRAATYAGMARLLKCSRCSCDVVAYVPMHDQALAQTKALGMVLDVLCFECTQLEPGASPQMKAAQRALYETNTRAAVIAEGDEGELTIVTSEPVIPSKGGGGFVH